MKKKLASILAALSLCCSLAVSAAAADMTTEEALRPVSLSTVDSSGADYTPSSRSQKLWLGNYDMAAGVLTLETISSVLPAPDGLTFTVANQGGAQDCFLVVRTIPHTPMSAAEAQEQYSLDDWSDDLSVVGDAPVYVGGVYGGGDYLCADNVWMSAVEGGADAAVRVEEGENVSFRLPDELQEGDVCRLYVDVYYPEAGNSFWTCFDILIDNSAAPAEEEEESSAPVFTDVSPDAWYAGYVQTVAEKGLFSGNEDGTFGPEDNMTYAQFLVVLSQFSGEQLPASEGAWYQSYVDWAQRAGLIPAEMTSFSPDASITRQDMAALFGNFLAAYDHSGEAVNEGEASFSDAASIADYAAEGVQTCYELGLMSGNEDGTFAPQDTATRAEVAVTMTQMARVMGR